MCAFWGLIMKKIRIKLPKPNEPSILKETKEERKERIKYASTMRTQIVPDKRRKSRAQQKAEDGKEFHKI